MKEYKALNIVSKTLYVVGMIILLLLGAIVAIFDLDAEAIPFILICLGVAFLGLISVAFSELILLLIRIEKNTRKNDDYTIKPDSGHSIN